MCRQPRESVRTGREPKFVGKGENTVSCRIYLGNDISKGRTDVYVCDGEQQKAAEPRVIADTAEGQNELHALLSELQERYDDPLFIVGMENTGGYERTFQKRYQSLRKEFRIELHVMNGLVVRRFGQAQLSRNQTDALSARTVAEYLAVMRPKPRQLPEEELLGLQGLCMVARGTQDELDRWQSRLEKLLSQVHPELQNPCRRGIPNWVLALVRQYPTGASLLRAKPEKVASLRAFKGSHCVGKGRAESLQRALRQQADALLDSEGYRTAVKQLAGELLRLRQQLESQKGEIGRLYQQLTPNELSTIGGIGEWSAALITVSVRDIDRFDRPEALTAFWGAHPALRESGVWKGTSRMSKQGDSVIRRVLYMCALSGIRHNPALRAYYWKKRNAGMAKKAALGACMRKLVHIIYAVLKTGKPWDPNYEQRFGGSTLATQAETSPEETDTASRDRQQSLDSDDPGATEPTHRVDPQPKSTPRRARPKKPTKNHVKSP